MLFSIILMLVVLAVLAAAMFGTFVGVRWLLQHLSRSTASSSGRAVEAGQHRTLSGSITEASSTMTSDETMNRSDGEPGERSDEWPDPGQAGQTAQTTARAFTSGARSWWESLTVRSFLIGALALLMLIPLLFVSEIVSERGQRYNDVLRDIAGTWGRAQTLLAPVLVVPFTETETVQDTVTDAAGEPRLLERTVSRRRHALFLPRTLDIDAELTDGTRRRGIFESLVYTADVSLQARFAALDPGELSDTLDQIHWDEARLVVGLSDTRAINEVSTFEWNGQPEELAPGTGIPDLQTGFHASVPDLTGGVEHSLSLSLSVNGSASFLFAPLGEVTRVRVTSPWPHPSFLGDALPDDYTIDDSGFSAQWEVPHLARNYPQRFVSDAVHSTLFEFTAGVSLFEPVSLYSQITRAAKYGVLFIALTYLTLLIFEISTRARVHTVQYILIGVALSLFYLVLLSLSEHMQFYKAYAIAALLCVLMISVYAGAVLRSLARGVGVFALLSALYAVLYSLLQLEDYALLLGTGLLVIVVAVLMVLTRNLSDRPDT